MKFPREVWPSANKQTTTFASKRKLVHNQEEFNDFVRLYNGKMNCFTSVYDYEQYTDKQAVTSTVILDRIFLDFDAHHGEVDKNTGAQMIKAQQIKDCLDDLDAVIHYLIYHGYKFDMSFSGRGFHVYVYGEPTRNIRRLTAFFNEVKELTINGTLDSSAISSRRLRRIRNTMNMKAAYENGCYYCIPLDFEESSNLTAEQIMELAKKPNNIPVTIRGNTLVKWPEVLPIEESNVEVDVIKVGKLPIPPCMHSAVMVENPTDIARMYLVSWYRDLLLWCDLNVPFTAIKIIPDVETRQQIVKQIVAEIKYLHETHDVWLDFKEDVTEFRTKYIIDGNYSFPNCNKLISDGYCIGKCWRLK